MLQFSISRENLGDPRNGTLIIRNLMNRSYLRYVLKLVIKDVKYSFISIFPFSAMGYKVYMDENADAEGNYTLLSFGSDSDQKLGKKNRSLT